MSVNGAHSCNANLFRCKLICKAPNNKSKYFINLIEAKTSFILNKIFYLNPTTTRTAFTGVTNTYEPSSQPTTTGSQHAVLRPQQEVTSGQSYKASMIVNYNSRVVIWGILKSGMTLES